MSSRGNSLSSRFALVRFLTPDEGGRSLPLLPDLRSQIELSSFQASCVVNPVPRHAEFVAGSTLRVEIRVMDPRNAGLEFADAKGVRLFDGGRLVAEGEFLDEN